MVEPIKLIGYATPKCQSLSSSLEIGPIREYRRKCGLKRDLHFNKGTVMRIADVFLPEFEREVARTRKVLEVIPADKMAWKLAEGFNTIGWNANHLVNIVEWTPSICSAPEFDLAPPDETPVPPQILTTAEELVAKIDEYAAASRKAIAATSDEAMGESWSLKMGGQVLLTVSKAECLETWVMNHLVHHRAILTVYLRHSGVQGVPEYGT